MLTCFDCEFSQIWSVNEDLKCKCKINGSEKNPYRPMVFADSDCPNWKASPESLFKEGLYLLQEKKRLNESLDEKIQNVFAKLDCKPIEITCYDDNKIQFQRGLQNLAYKLQIETHTELHSDGNDQLVCKWEDFTLFELIRKGNFNA